MNTAPPKISRLNARVGVALAGVLVAVIAAMVFFFNPSTHGFYPVCQFHRLTGLNCPGCGGTRSLYALLHGHLREALRDNALFIGGFVFLAARASWFAMRNRLGRATGEFFPAPYLWLLLAAMLVFTVLRNLPAFAFLSP